MVKKEFITGIDYNKSAEPCPTCALECKEINRKVNNRKLSDIEDKEVAHIFDVFDIER